MEYKGFVELNFKTVTDDDNQVTIEGWASKSVIDRDGDLVEPYGVDLTNFNKNPILLFNHDFSQPIGKVLSIKPTKEGLYIKAVIHKELNEKVFNAVKKGVLKTFSIGFRGLDGEYDNENNYFVFTKTELFEVSVVSVPANQDAIFEVIQVCEDGMCTLGKKGFNPALEKKAIKNGEVSETPWSEIDKTELKKVVAEKGERYIKEAFLVVPDVDLKSTWKFPHHEMKDGDLILNKNGVIAAWAALKGARSRPNISSEQKLQAAKHLLKHYKTLKSKNLVEEIPQELLDMVKELEGEVIKMYEGKANDTAYTVENIVDEISKETGIDKKDVRLMLMFLNFSLFKEDGSKTKFADKYKFRSDKIYEDLYSWLKDVKQEYKGDKERDAFSLKFKDLSLSTISRASAWIYNTYVSENEGSNSEKILTSRVFAESWFFNTLGITLDNLLKFKSVVSKVDEYKDVVDQFARGQQYETSTKGLAYAEVGIKFGEEDSKSVDEAFTHLWEQDPDEALMTFEKMSKFINAEINKILTQGDE